MYQMDRLEMFGGGLSRQTVVFVAKAYFETGIELWACNANHTCACVGSLFSQDHREPYPLYLGTLISIRTYGLSISAMEICIASQRKY